MHPEARYVKSGDLHVAYQVVGEGPPDMLVVPNWLTHAEAFWEHPHIGRFLKRLASFGRIIHFDQPGTGLSDPVSLAALPTLEQWMDNARVVLDVAGAERVALLAQEASGPMAILFAATYPGRTSALVLADSFARFLRDDDYPWGLPRHLKERYLQAVVERWGTGADLEFLAPSAAGHEEERRLWGRLERQAASPGTAGAMIGMVFDTDVRHVLPAIRVPTLVLHRAGDRYVRVEHGRYLAEHIHGARYVELPGDDHFAFFGDMEGVVAEIQEFLTGVREAPDDSDRVLATLLFTDIVGSTERAAEAGDRRWRELLDAHDEMVRRQLERFRGREVKTIGDGFLVTFDGPARAIRCAAAIREGARRLGLEIRAGLHTGECEMRGEDVGGIAAHIASRVVAEAGSGEVLVSSTVKDLVAGSGIGFADRGPRTLKGVPGEWRLYAAEE